MKRLDQSSVFVIAVSVAVAGVAHPTYADVGDQLAELLAHDGAEGDQVGISVAISDPIAIISAPPGDDHSASGSAYGFDTCGPTGTPATLTRFVILDGALISGGLPVLASHDHMYLETETMVKSERSQPLALRAPQPPHRVAREEDRHPAPHAERLPLTGGSSASHGAIDIVSPRGCDRRLLCNEGAY